MASPARWGTARHPIDFRVDVKNNVATQGIITNIAAVYPF